MDSKATIVRGHAEGERRWFLGGGVHVWKLTAEETGGDLFMFEDLLVQGKVTPLHRHPDVAETLYLLEGSLVAWVGGEQREVGPGGVAMFPRGVPHALRVTSPTARLLCVQAPASTEAFYRAASAPTTADSGPVDFGRLGAIAREHPAAIEILGPPPFAR